MSENKEKNLGKTYPSSDDIFDLDKIPMEVLDKGYQSYSPYLKNFNPSKEITPKYMDWLKKYEIWNEKFKLINIGHVHSNRVELYDLDELEAIPDKYLASEIMKPKKVLSFSDSDARAFVYVKLYCGEFGQYEKFVIGSPSHAHWRLYNQCIEDFNNQLAFRSKDNQKSFSVENVEKIDASYDGRIWEESKFLVLKSHADFEARLPQIYRLLLEAGVDTRDYSLLIPKLIPEVDDIYVAWRGIYSCRIDGLLNL